MSNPAAFEKQLCDYVESHRDRLVEIIRDLVRIPSENKPPRGTERECQEYTAGFLRAVGLQPDVYELSEVDGLLDHPLYWPGNNYANRPNVGARRKGANGGRSLVLSGHIDTVPCGTLEWTRDPFGGQVEGNRLYGRGSNDMKGGVGINLFIMEALAKMGVTLGGDLVFESIVDEEFGGVNGTLAGRLRGFNGDAAVITEPTFLRICAGHRGGRTVHITLRAPGGILSGGEFPSGVMQQLTCFLNAVKDFAQHRRNTAPQHELFASSIDPVPVSITKVFTSPWGTDEPITVPETCKLEMYWQLMPGESQEAVDQEFFNWLDRMVAGAPELFPSRPKVTFPIRWLPGSAISQSEPVVTELAACAGKVLGCEPPIGAEDGPCDMFVFSQGFGIPAVLWGPSGGNTHGADEYLEIDSALIAAKSLLLFVCDWCGTR
jgi:acetylornithine deacetylase